MAGEDDDAFAATVAPHDRGAPSRAGGPADLAVGATMAAPASVAGSITTSHALPTRGLPTVAVDAYHLDREIARGGMGKIVAAEDQRLGRRVALKVLLEPAGDALGRFQREALITARLQHPGIVPVYEAGQWPSGEPFFAMKLVAGRPLDRVIAEAKTFEERLALLPRIAAATDAIAYAHSQRVVHRDLKPANVLVGDFGETVVIDWGLAKDLDATESVDRTAPPSGGAAARDRIAPPPPPAGGAAGRDRTASPAGAPPGATSNTASSTLTVAGAVMGTPAYMAPEQARGESVDQRADVFALGAMLYHLLAGAPPYNARTASDVIAAAALGRVVPLTDREQRAPADLVAIVHRAMAQDPAARYPDAGELAEELRRFLTGQLVSAHQYTTRQRVMRFVRKHRAAVTIAAVASLALGIGGTYAVRQVVQERNSARRERDLAEVRRGAAEELIDEMLFGLRAQLEGIGRLDLLASLGGEIRDYYTTLAQHQDARTIEGLGRMAQAVDLVGGAERDSGQVDRALATFRDARDQLVASVGDDRSPATYAQRVMLARLEFGIGTCLQQRGKHAEASAAYDAAKRAFLTLGAEQPDDGRVLLFAAETHDRIGDLARNDGRLDGALDEYTSAKVAREVARQRASTRPLDEVMALSTSHMKLGSIYQARADTAAALDAYRTALRLRETVLESDNDNMDYQWRVLEAQDALAELQRILGDARSAVTTYEQAMPIMTALIQRDPTNTTWKRQRGNLLADLGFALLDAGDYQTGLLQLEAAIDSQQGMLAQDPQSTAWSMDLARTFLRCGDALVYLGKYDDAIARYEEALDIRRKLAQRDPKSAAYRRGEAWANHKLANVYALRGDVTRSLELHERVLPRRAKLAADSPVHTGYSNELASTEVTMGRVLAARDPARATMLVAQGLERARALAATDPVSNEWKETVTQGLLARAEVERVAGRLQPWRDALVEAKSVAESAAQKAPRNWLWPGFLGEIHAGLAELASARGDRPAAILAWAQVVGYLAQLEQKGQLPAPRRALLARARTQR